MIDIKSGYMDEVYDRTSVLARDAKAVLVSVKYDTMVGTGLSGALVIPRVAQALGKHWLIIRKPGESTHSDEPAEGELGSRWLFVDDFVSSGATRQRVLEAVGGIVKNEDEQHSVYQGVPPTYVGSAFYHGNWNYGAATPWDDERYLKAAGMSHLSTPEEIANGMVEVDHGVAEFDRYMKRLAALESAGLSFPVGYGTQEPDTVTDVMFGKM